LRYFLTSRPITIATGTVTLLFKTDNFKHKHGISASEAGIFRVRVLQRLELSLFAGVTAVEGIHTAFGIHQLLLAGKEGVAFGTDADRRFGSRGENFKLVAAGTAYDAFLKLGMDIRFHCTILSIDSGIGYEQTITKKQASQFRESGFAAQAHPTTIINTDDFDRNFIAGLADFINRFDTIVRQL